MKPLFKISKLLIVAVFIFSNATANNSVDFSISKLTCTPYEVWTPGKVNMIIKNTYKTSCSLNIHFFLSKDSLLETGAYLLKEVNVNMSDVLEETPFQDALTILDSKKNVTSGKYYLIAVLDYNNRIDETDESNNQYIIEIDYVAFHKIADLTLFYKKAPLPKKGDNLLTTPDLDFTSVSALFQKRTSKEIHLVLRYLCRNNSNFPTEKYTKILVALSKDEILSPDDKYLYEFDVWIMGAKENKEVIEVIDIPQWEVAPGKYYAIYYIDSKNLIKEKDEANNYKSFEVMIE